MDIEKTIKQAEEHWLKNQSKLNRLRDHPNLDQAFLQLHEETFKKVDCLSCANCCKTTSPILLLEDMDRIANYLNKSTSWLLQHHVEMDEDGDFVFTSAPCPFLNSDNSCQVYEVRPKACSEYPHTNRKDMSEILDLTLKNTLVCPAVSTIVDQLEES